jgi:hypothetical protein
MPAIGGAEIRKDAGGRELDFGMQQGEKGGQVVLVHRPVNPLDHVLLLGQVQQSPDPRAIVLINIGIQAALQVLRERL